MDFVVKKKPELIDGVHYGTIKGIDYRTDPYEYTDMFIQPDDAEIELKYGCPSNLMEGGKLFKLVSEFTKLEIGATVNLEKVLLGKRVSFITMKEKGKDGNMYSRIVAGSVHPAQEKNVV